jgi:protein-tyrosine phosphatase
LRLSGLLLLWPALSLAIVSMGHFGLGAGIFRKKSGRVPWITRVVLGPVLLGQWLSLLYYKLKSPAWNTLTDRVWIGRKLSNAEARRAIQKGVTAVLDLTGEFTEAAPFRRIVYRQLSILDLTAPPPAQLAAAIAFLNEQPQHGIVYIHCKAGYSRTAAVAGAYLLASHQADSAEEALSVLRARRPGIVIRPEARAAIELYQERLQLCLAPQPL